MATTPPQLSRKDSTSHHGNRPLPLVEVNLDVVGAVDVDQILAAIARSGLPLRHADRHPLPFELARLIRPAMLVILFA
jgi:hypothetical protein